MIRLRSRSRLVQTYVRGRANPESLALFWRWVDEQSEALAAPTPRVMVDGDDDERSFTIWVNGRELTQAWMLRERHKYPELEEVISRLFALPLRDVEEIKIDREDWSFDRWYLPPPTVPASPNGV